MKFFALYLLSLFATSVFAGFDTEFIDTRIGRLFMPANEKNYSCDYVDSLSPKVDSQSLWFVDGYYYRFNWYDSDKADWSEVWPFLKNPQQKIEGENAKELEIWRELFFSFGSPKLADSSSSHLFFTFEGSKSHFESKSLQYINGSYLEINKHKRNVYSKEECESISIGSIVERIIDQQYDN
ncbi:hypothetical protein [Agarivorans albus]|uniref:hypothetical protein n=1 Tax=Agarivorans albus TaxID=182262 RepID=UPI00058FF2A7|nr:hypothetical protein [Agarivorans albus]